MGGLWHVLRMLDGGLIISCGWTDYTFMWGFWHFLGMLDGGLIISCG